MNPYYTYSSGQPVTLSRASSVAIRTEFGAIQTGFDAVLAAMNGKGAISGQNWIGTHDFTSGTIKVPTLAQGSAGSFAASVDYVNQTAFANALPAQSGNADKLVTTDGANTNPVASFTDKLNVSVLKFVDGTDKTKRMQFDASGVTTSTTRTITVPDRNVMLGGFANMVVITVTGTWTAPSWCSRAMVVVQDGGQGGSYNTGGSGQGLSGGSAGNAGISILPIVPGGTYTATIGQGTATATGSIPLGGPTSFAGPGITTLTTSNASLKFPGGPSGTPVTTNGGLGGASYLAPFGSTGYGAGGKGGNDTGAGGTAGQNGCLILYY